MGDELALEHEKQFVDSFILRERRERYLGKLSSRKNRRQFLDRLNHGLRGDLDGRFLSQAGRAWPHNMQQCYLIADEEQFDGRFVPASEALVLLGEASFGLIVSFLPGKLACYQDEQPSGLLWLERRDSAPAVGRA